MSQRSHRAGFVVIAGRPNAGKSTLLNALIGEKVAITAPQAQTTRTSLQGVLTLPDAQIIFVDTPGIHQANSVFGRRMMDTVRNALQDRDLVLYVADALKPIAEEDRQALAALGDTRKVLLVLNKVDRVQDKRLLLPSIEQYQATLPFLHAVPVSARTGDGLEELKRLIVDHLPESDALFPEDHLTDQPMRFLAAELIRERILFAAREEVPHSSAVLIDSWEESSSLIRIAATIYVERPGQKAILIGAKGSLLKEIGTGARQDIERLTGSKIFLSLFVKVKPKWREDAAFLNTIDWRATVGNEGTE